MLNRTLLFFRNSSMWLWFLLLLLLPHVFNIMYKGHMYIIEWPMYVINTPVNLTLVADSIGMMFSATVIFISANVLMFSKVYMKEEKFKDRFTVLVILFIMSMNFLIFIPHFMALLLGWDGLGLVSFILVIYYQNPKSLAAGMITALTNRVGDVLLLVSIGLTLNQGHWLIINMWDSSMSKFQIMFIMLAAMTKSAQMPFSSWLPAAMAAPTPVSALVHSSTLVTAGVFLLIRFYPFLHKFQMFNTMILVIAVSTMFMAGISATTECDAKKIIALSTLSQLGMMMTALGFNLPNVAFFHMITHALFKALLFVCAGSLIHAHLHTQDLRWMGNITNQMPVATSCMTLANLALCGFPFMAGFYSKDMIMEAALTAPNNFIMLTLSMISLGFTSFYSIRFSITTMWGPNLISPWMTAHEEKYIIAPMAALSMLSISIGSFMSWFYPVSAYSYNLPMILKILPLLMVTLGLMLGMLLSKSVTNNSLMMNFHLNHWASCNMWFLVPLSSQFTLKWPMMMAHYMMKFIDQGWLENMSGMKINSSINKMNLIISNNSPKLPSMYIFSSIIMAAIIFMSI